jgi:hypothetical protein
MYPASGILVLIENISKLYMNCFLRKLNSRKSQNNVLDRRRIQGEFLKRLQTSERGRLLKDDSESRKNVGVEIQSSCDSVQIRAGRYTVKTFLNRFHSNTVVMVFKMRRCEYTVSMRDRGSLAVYHEHSPDRILTSGRNVYS